MPTTNSEGLALMRKPFPENCISKLPKPTKKQTDEVRADFKKGIRCQICGGWHHPKVVHLDYVGHAALTDRLLDCDLEWGWEPYENPNMPSAPDGMWIKLTVCGVSRIGYGSADGKTGGNAIKEIIGDALRNAAMRFGAALDLWHKGDLHSEDDGEDDSPIAASMTKANARDLYGKLQEGLRAQSSVDELTAWAKAWSDDIKTLPADWIDNIRSELRAEIDAHEAVEA